MVNVTHTGCDANIQSWLGCLFLAQGHRESLEMGKRATWGCDAAVSRGISQTLYQPWNNNSSQFWI